MRRVLPILFNTDMTEAVLEGRKGVTRRAVKYKYDNTTMQIRRDKYGSSLIEIHEDRENVTYGKNPDGSTWRKLRPYIEKEMPCHKGDLLYVRETWAFLPCIDCLKHAFNTCEADPVTYKDKDRVAEGCFVYRAGCRDRERISWRPSIHMPKAAARIWLEVTDVRAERLQEMTLDDFLAEGVSLLPETFNDPENAYWQARRQFEEIWDSTIPKEKRGIYGWNADSWVWVIEFSRCGAPEWEV